jgi:hypothetical protein
MLEINLMTSNVSWVNDFFLEKTGYTLDQMSTMSLFDIVPENLHDRIRDNIADRIAGKRPELSILPIKTTDGRIAWWYVNWLRTDYPLTWAQGDHVQTTQQEGSAFIFMQTAMTTANGYMSLQNQIHDLRQWTENQVGRLDEEDRAIKMVLSGLEEKLRHATEASRNAANYALENSKSIELMRKEMSKGFENFEGEFSKHTTEILRLIGTDAAHDKRFIKFEKNVKMTTDLAIQSITMHAAKAGRGMSKKVVIPVSVIAAIATIAQYLVQWWVKTH